MYASSWNAFTMGIPVVNHPPSFAGDATPLLRPFVLRRPSFEPSAPTVFLDVALKLEDNCSVFRLGGAVDEYSIQRRPRNTETNVRFDIKSSSSSGSSSHSGKIFCSCPGQLVCVAMVVNLL